MAASDFRDRLPANMRSAYDDGMAAAVRDGWQDEVRRYVDAYAVAEGHWFDETAAAAIDRYMKG